MAVKTKKRQQGTDFDDTNRGVLFQNDKGDNDARPDMTGTLAIDPNDFELDDQGLIRIRLAAWKKDSPSAGEYLSIAASTPKQSR